MDQEISYFNELDTKWIDEHGELIKAPCTFEPNEFTLNRIAHYIFELKFNPECTVKFIVASCIWQLLEFDMNDIDEYQAHLRKQSKMQLNKQYRLTTAKRIRLNFREKYISQPIPYVNASHHESRKLKMIWLNAFNTI
eukprot:431793_1